MSNVMPGRRTPVYTVLSGTSHFCAIDSSIAVGDIMVLVIEQVTSATTPAPTGWTLRASNAHNTRILLVFTKLHEKDETGVTVARSTAGAGKAITFGISGATTDPSTWVIGTIKGRSQSPADSSTTTTALSITTAKTNTLVINIFGEATTNNETATPPTIAGATFWHYTPQTQASSEIETVLLAYEEMPTAGATGNTVATYQNVQAQNSAAIQIGFPGVETTSTPIARLPVKVADGQGGIIDAYVVATESDGAGGIRDVGLSKLEYVHGGTFVPDLDRLSRVWTMSHRGGSIDYQEHTLRGYMESAIRHIDVLEISLAITSDKRLIGAHDVNADRTSSAVNGQNWRFDQHTWAEVQALTQDLSNRGDTRFTTDRYYLLDEIIEKFSATHTIMYDPKLIGTADRANYLYPRIQQITDYQRRSLGKFFHTGTGIADEFHAIGVKVWGYAYIEAITGFKTNGQPTTDKLLSETAAKWDYLGMEYGASQAVWTETLRIANGKIVIGHIVDTIARADEAVSKGARALQVSGVRTVQTKY